MLERVSPGCVVAGTRVTGLILSATAHPPLSAISRGEAVASMMGSPPASREVGVPTVHRFGPYRFFFWSHENRGTRVPPHIHVTSGDCLATFGLSPVSLRESWGYTPCEIVRIRRVVVA